MSSQLSRADSMAPADTGATLAGNSVSDPAGKPARRRRAAPRLRRRPRSGIAARRPPRYPRRLVGEHQFGAPAQGGIRIVRKEYQLVKRFLDIAVCLITIPLALPLLALSALAVWLEDGRPVLFTQLRTGRGGRRFQIYKFRTMVKNAEELKQQFWHLNKMSGPEFKLADDPRVTRVGAFLRKTSLDEIPQLFNVLKGDMSLVGPRPTSFDASKYVLWQTERLEVLPGITGLAQVSGRSELSFEEKLRLDIEYVERRGFWLDLQILLRTAVVLLSHRGAC